MTDLETREVILKTAIRLLSQHGFASVSMNDVVRESGVSKGGVYWHFKNKDDLVLAVLDSLLCLMTLLLASSASAILMARLCPLRVIGCLGHSLVQPARVTSLLSNSCKTLRGVLWSRLLLSFRNPWDSL